MCVASGGGGNKKRNDYICVLHGPGPAYGSLPLITSSSSTILYRATTLVKEYTRSTRDDVFVHARCTIPALTT